MSRTENRVEHDLLGAGPKTVEELRSVAGRLRIKYQKALERKERNASRKLATKGKLVPEEVQLKGEEALRLVTGGAQGLMKGIREKAAIHVGSNKGESVLPKTKTTVIDFVSGEEVTTKQKPQSTIEQKASNAVPEHAPSPDLLSGSVEEEGDWAGGHVPEAVGDSNGFADPSAFKIDDDDDDDL
mmetsp:Transcript_24718/g.36893  ORF Transcript_24718/g.36893 Transcript_24718/m.36893 type:complete len:185 (-) Transcript_24718:87-641(-)